MVSSMLAWLHALINFRDANACERFEDNCVQRFTAKIREEYFRLLRRRHGWIRVDLYSMVSGVESACSASGVNIIP